MTVEVDEGGSSQVGDWSSSDGGNEEGWIRSLDLFADEEFVEAAMNSILVARFVFRPTPLVIRLCATSDLCVTRGRALRFEQQCLQSYEMLELQHTYVFTTGRDRRRQSLKRRN